MPSIRRGFSLLRQTGEPEGGPTKRPHFSHCRMARPLLERQGLVAAGAATPAPPTDGEPRAGCRRRMGNPGGVIPREAKPPTRRIKCRGASGPRTGLHDAGGMRVTSCPHDQATTAALRRRPWRRVAQRQDGHDRAWRTEQKGMNLSHDYAQ